MGDVLICATYIWLDGTQPTKKLRSKTRILPSPKATVTSSSFPDWTFDGSSTSQAQGNYSDLYLKPVRFFPDPTQGTDYYLVLCEVFNTDDKTSHKSNTRSLLKEIMEKEEVKNDEVWIGFEQEYTLFFKGTPLGWPEKGVSKPQGPFYCGVGIDQVSGRNIVEKHLKACLDANIYMCGVNAEVMLGQWEYQIGHRGFEGETADPLNIADQIWVSRWLLERIAEDFSVTVSFDNKPVKGDWNGAGMHTNFSTKKMRDKEIGLREINEAIDLLSKKHKEHIEVYGDRLEERLTGLHENCNINEFKSGASDRGASIRVPAHVAAQGYGYFEDRRPGANADPYLVAHRLVKTVCSSSQLTEPSLLKSNYN